MGVEHYVIDADSCIGCAICEDVCPEHAVHVLHPEEAEAEKAAAHAAAKAELDAQHKKGDPGVAAPPGQEGGKNFFGKKPKPKP
jgi:formate hydrogenlyase subunit 6/NADH:ubiquinone oxidoreductase subunit I